MYEKRLLSGAQIYPYIRVALSWGDALSRSLLNLPLEDGPVFAYLAPSFMFNERTDLKYGNPLAQNDPWGGYNLEVEFILDYLRSDLQSVALFECAWYEDEPALKKSRTPYILVEGSSSRPSRQSCYFLDSSASSDAICQAENEAASGRSWEC